MTDTLIPFAWIAAAGLLAPVLSFATSKKVPAVVFLIILGVLIGPFGLELTTDSEAIDLVRELGLGMLFLLAGMELAPSDLKGKEGRNAILTWIICALLAFGATMALTGGETGTATVLAIALTSTALGTLLPIIRQQGLSGTPVGNSVMIHGAVGELAPVMAMALLLSARTTWATAVILVIFFAVALVIALLPRTVRRVVPWVGWAIRDGVGSTNQTVVRTIVVMLAALMAVASIFELDVVLGAFAGGIIVRQIVPDSALPDLTEKLEVLGYGLFIPAFFVTSGMGIDTGVIGDRPWFLLGLIPVILIARGLPVLLRELGGHTGSSLQGWREKLQLSLYAATGLPIIVAVTEVATSSGLLAEEEASLLVAAGALTVAVFPMVADAVGPTKRAVH
ncbi:cation:proton antiporter [Corynebacterium variabile]|uniref:cation:proton antiporter n=1 Tax=Corynebacterium variabile TaxID=1727 RepID=UPI001E138099|nr:cation:proton antiporter [Corynebacterium variabile]HJG47067.1 cation:proton antiporter [Corynebacterium variabile]